LGLVWLSVVPLIQKRNFLKQQKKLHTLAQQQAYE
jgi:hypothetical protein